MHGDAMASRRAYIRQVGNQRERRRWHLRQIKDEIEPSERGRHVLGARKKSERETRKLRCAKPSAPKSSRGRMKPILDWTKSNAEAYAPGAAPKGTFPSPFSFRLFSWNLRDCLPWKALRKSAAVRCVLRPSKVAPAHRVSQPNLRGVYPRRRCPLWVMSEHFTKF